MKKILVISGFSGVGKGTVVKQLLSRNPELWLSISDTTRERRNETDQYSFISETEFTERIRQKEYLEYNCYSGRFYGTPIKPVLSALESGRTVILEIDLNGANQVRQDIRIKDTEIITVFLTASAEELFTRLRNRGDTPESIRKRLKIAAEEICNLREYDYIINNNNVEDTVLQIEKILQGIEIESDRVDVEKFKAEIEKICL